MEAEAQAESIRVSPLYYTLSSSFLFPWVLPLKQISDLVPTHFKISACVLDEGGGRGFRLGG